MEYDNKHRIHQVQGCLPVQEVIANNDDNEKVNDDNQNNVGKNA